MKEDSEKQKGEDVNVFLGQNCVFNGKMTSEGIFRLEGKVEGEIYHGGTLIIGQTATIKAKLNVNALILDGFVEGEVTAKERVEIGSRGKLYGTILTPIFVIQDGGIFQGNCKMRTILDDETNLQDAREAISRNSIS